MIGNTLQAVGMKIRFKGLGTATGGALLLGALVWFCQICFSLLLVVGYQAVF